jgi:3-mercaptopyruvate sulfurtransferase SseA
VALQLRKAGIRHVRPLEGGLDAWRALGYPLQPVILPRQDEALTTRLGVDAPPAS